MVQRKEPSKVSPKTKGKTKPHSRDHHRHESPVSKETSSGSSNKKNMKYLPNYMRPTSSSDAWRDHSQVTRHNSPSVTSSTQSFTPDVLSSPPSITSKRNPAKPFLKRNKSRILFQQLHNRATCSSTLKDSKFPQALDLNHGGTESDGTSVFRVCPYTYCSLNGHAHEPLPPLKSFLASKRKLIKTQESMKLKGLSPFRKKEQKNSEKEVSPLLQEVVHDFIVEISTNSTKKIEEPAKTEENDVSEYHEAVKIIGKGEELKGIYTGLEHKSDFSIEEMDAVLKFVEYVSCDQGLGCKQEKCSDLLVEAQTEQNNLVGSDENIKNFEIFSKYSDHVNFMEYLDVLSDNQSFSSEFTYGGSDRKSQEKVQNDGVEELLEEIKEREKEIESGKGVEKMIDFKIDERSESEIENKMVPCSKEDESERVKEDDKFNLVVDFGDGDNGIGFEEEILGEKEERKEETNSEVDPSNSDNTKSNNSLEIDNTCEVEIPTQEPNSSVDSENPKTLDIDELSLEFSKMVLEGEDFSFDPTCHNQKTRLIFAKIRDVKDDSEYLRRFNPRAPNFLDLEEDPSEEKVDLRHQLVDDRKNAEEWMIDYALRRAVDELAPVRKKKVQLLVAAFETVVPVQGGGGGGGGGVTCN